jgi:hypothetical protein
MTMIQDRNGFRAPRRGGPQVSTIDLSKDDVGRAKDGPAHLQAMDLLCRGHLLAMSPRLTHLRRFLGLT